MVRFQGKRQPKPFAQRTFKAVAAEYAVTAFFCYKRVANQGDQDHVAIQ